MLMHTSSLSLFLLALLTTAQAFRIENPSRPFSSSGRHLKQRESRSIDVSTADELEQALKEAQTGQTIVLNGSKFVLSTTLSIEKPGVHLKSASSDTPTLECPENGSIFHIREGNITLSSLTFEGCAGYPAVVVEPDDAESSSESVVFDQVTFRGNSNDDFFTPGGAIFATGCSDEECDDMVLNIEIRDCFFEDNESDMGGAIYGERCSLEVIRSNFTNNSARTNGGAIYVAGLGTQLKISESQFLDNSVTEEGFETIVYREGGLPIEHDNYFHFKSPGNGGGAVAAVSAENLTVTKSIFLSNQALSGGAIYATMDATELSGLQNKISISIADSHFENNQATNVKKAEDSDLRSNLGGAVYLASATAALKGIDIENCIFRNNSAQSSGGALHAVTVFQDKVSIDGCVFEKNEATSAGGAVLLRNSGDINVRNSSWSMNSANLGGAIMLTNGAQFTAKPMFDASGEEVLEWRNLFKRNSAVDGGGLMCVGCGTLVLKNVNLTENLATRNGGGLLVLDSSHSVSIEQSLFNGNAASHGGGAAFRAAASVKLESARSNLHNEFVNNTALSGGGIFVESNRQRENAFQMKNCLFAENHAVDPKTLEAVFSAWTPSFRKPSNATSIPPLNTTESTMNEASIAPASLKQCGIGGGGGMCLAFDDVPDGATADIGVSSVTFKHNTALVGGGMFVNAAGSWNTEQKVNCVIGALTTEPCRLFHMLKMTFIQNMATFGGGGFFVSDPEMVTVGCGLGKSHMKKWKTLDEATEETSPLSECFRFEKNSVMESGGHYGPNMASSAYSLSIVESPSGAVSGCTEGMSSLLSCKDLDDLKGEGIEGVTIEIKDAFNQTITGGIPDARLHVLVLSADTLEEQVYRATNGTVNIDRTESAGVGPTSVIGFSQRGTSGKRLQVHLTPTTDGLVPDTGETNSR